MGHCSEEQHWTNNEQQTASLKVHLKVSKASNALQTGYCPISWRNHFRISVVNQWSTKRSV